MTLAMPKTLPPKGTDLVALFHSLYLEGLEDYIRKQSLFSESDHRVLYEHTKALMISEVALASKGIDDQLYNAYKKLFANLIAEHVLLRLDTLSSSAEQEAYLKTFNSFMSYAKTLEKDLIAQLTSQDTSK